MECAKFTTTKFFDLVISVASIEQLNDLDLMADLLQKVRMWIKPNGRLFLKLLTEQTDERLFRAPLYLTKDQDLNHLLRGFEYETCKVKGVTPEFMEFSHHLVIGRPK